MMASSKTWNHHIHDIIYIIYKDNIFQNKKEINFVPITAPSFIRDTETFDHCIEIIDDAVNPYQTKSSKKQLDKAEIKMLVMTLMSSAS